MPEITQVSAYQLPRSTSYMPNPSPACVRLETFLRLARLPHTVSESAQPGANGRWPFVKLTYGDGKSVNVHDSWAIINRIGADVGPKLPVLRVEDLTPAQQLTGESIRLLVDHTAYFSLVRNRWVENKEDLLRTYRMAVRMPRFLQRWFFLYIRKQIIHTLDEHGNGEVSFEESEQQYVTVLKVIEKQLNESKGPFLFGDRPSVYDTVAWTALWVVYAPALGSAGKTYIGQSTRLQQYVQLIQTLAFPDLPSLTQATLEEEKLGTSFTCMVVLTAITAVLGLGAYGVIALGRRVLNV